jgi:AAA+ ATPase superfamily predicted ATPase
MNTMIGREEEKRMLNKLIDSEKAELLLVTGRRNSG